MNAKSLGKTLSNIFDRLNNGWLVQMGVVQPVQPGSVYEQSLEEFLKTPADGQASVAIPAAVEPQ